MPTAPWASDRPLDTATALAVIAEQLPELRPVRGRFLAAGWDSEAFLVNEEWIVRFPKRRDAVPYLEREARILPRVAEALDLPVPAPELFGRPCERFPYPFFGHRFLPGVSADAPEAPPLHEESAARDLGRALSQLHAIPAESVASLSLPAEGDRCAGWLRWVVECANGFRRAMPPEVAARWEPWLRGEVELPPAAPGPFPLCHNDLGAEHVLVDPDSGRVAGIIDWGDAALVDPAVDFAGLHLFRGEPFCERVLRHYGRPVDAAFLARVRFTAVALALTLVAEGERSGDTAGLARWRRFFLDVFEPRVRS